MPPDGYSIIPVPPSARGDGAQAGAADRRSPSYELGLSRNAERRFEPIPVVFGRHRVVPPLGARVIQEVVNGQVWQRILFVVGYGPLAISDIRISGRPIAEYTDITVETREGRSGDAALTLYTGTPIAFPKPLALIAMRVRVTDQLPRNVDEVSCIAAAEALDWDEDEATWTRQSSSNPASMMRLALQHPGRRNVAADADIDLDALQAFHGFCETNGYQFNAIHDTRRSIFDLVTDICAVARARPRLATGQWSVTIDRETADPVEHFCPLNMDNFRVRGSLESRPDAVRVRFPNRGKDWRRDERVIYRSGFDAGTAAEIETFSPFGITGAGHVWKWGSRRLADQEKNEIWSGDISTENVILKAGDRVTVSHESIGAGIASAWVTTVGTDSAGTRDRDIGLDAPIFFEGAGPYYAKLRTDGNADLVVRLDIATGPDSDPLETLRIRVADRPAAGTIRPGDLLSVGTGNKVRAEAVVTSIDRRGDLAASIAMIPVRQAVYDAEKGTVPDFVSTLSDISTPLPALVVTSVSSGIDVRRRIGTVVAPRIELDVTPIPVAGSRIECQIREADDTEYGPSEIEAVGITKLTVGGVVAGTSYRIRARWVLPEDNRVGDWTEQSHTVAQLRPNPPRNFSAAEDEGGSRRFRFTPPGDDDLAGVEIRYSASRATAWAAMTKLHEGLLTASPLWSYLPAAGTWSFEARAVDTDGLYSATGARVEDVALGAIRSLGRFKELQAFRKQAATAAAPARPEDGSYNFATATYTPPAGWSATWPAHDQDEVVYAIAATAQDEEGDPWQADEDDWSDPAIISDVGDINLIYGRGTAAAGGVGAGQNYTAPARPDPSEGIPDGWYDDISSVPAGAGLIYVSLGLRKRGQAVFTWGTPEQIQAEPTITAIEVPLYRKIALAATLHSGSGAPAVSLGVNGDIYRRTSNSTIYEKAGGAWSLVLGGDWDHSTRTMGSVGSWSQEFPTYNAVTEKVACTVATGFSDDTRTDWSALRICEAAGDLNAVYLRAASGTTPATPPTGTRRVPTSWVDNPKDLSGTGLAWVSIGHRPWGEANWTWGAPNRIDALDGQDGEDGQPGRIGLTGSAGRISRATRVASRSAANTNTEWHMTAATFDGNRTINLGGVSAAEKELIGRILAGGIVTLFHDPDNWADYNLVSVSFATVQGNEQARLSLTYIEHVGSLPIVGDSAGTTMHVHFTPEGPVGRDGTDGTDGSRGTSFKELQAYRTWPKSEENDPDNPTDTVERAPGSNSQTDPGHDWGSFDFNSKAFVPPTGWSATWPETVTADQEVWGIFATADDGSNVEWTPGQGDWAGPILLEQDTDVLVVYQRADRSTTPGATSGVPTGWYNDVDDVPAGSNPIYVVIGTRKRGQTLYTWDASTQLEGQDGTDGVNGTVWHFGDSTPGNSLGADGDFYLETDEQNVWTKSGGTWSTQGSLKGANGAVWFNGTSVPAAALGTDGDWYFRVGTGAQAAQVYTKTTRPEFFGTVNIQQVGLDFRALFTNGVPSSLRVGDRIQFRDNGNVNREVTVISIPSSRSYAEVNTGPFTGNNGGFLEFDNPRWITQIDIDQGSEGAVWHSADSDPGGSLGNVGNWFLNTDSGAVFEKTGDSTWTERSNIFAIKDSSVHTQHLAANAVSDRKKAIDAASKITVFNEVERTVESSASVRRLIAAGFHTIVEYAIRPGYYAQVRATWDNSSAFVYTRDVGTPGQVSYAGMGIRCRWYRQSDQRTPLAGRPLGRQGIVRTRDSNANFGPPEYNRSLTYAQFTRLRGIAGDRDDRPHDTAEGMMGWDFSGSFVGESSDEATGHNYWHTRNDGQLFLEDVAPADYSLLRIEVIALVAIRDNAAQTVSIPSNLDATLPSIDYHVIVTKR